MARPATIEVYHDRKVQLDQFEPITYGATVTVEIEDGDDYEAVFSEYVRELEDAVDREITRRIARKKMDAGDSD